MLGLPPSVRIYFATELADMRKGIDGLRAIVEGALRHDPYAGHLFVFVGKSRDKDPVLGPLGIRALIEAAREGPLPTARCRRASSTGGDGGCATRDAPRRHRSQRSSSRAMDSQQRKHLTKQKGDRHRAAGVIKAGRWSCRPSTRSARSRRSSPILRTGSRSSNTRTRS